MGLKMFRASWILLLIFSTIAALGGATMIFYPQFFMANEIKNYVGQTWSSLEAANQKLFSYFLHDVRLLGFMQFTAALVMIVIVLIYYRKLDKPSWYICLGINPHFSHRGDHSRASALRRVHLSPQRR